MIPPGRSQALTNPHGLQLEGSVGCRLAQLGDAARGQLTRLEHTGEVIGPGPAARVDDAAILAPGRQRDGLRQFVSTG